MSNSIFKESAAKELYAAHKRIAGQLEADLDTQKKARRFGSLRKVVRVVTLSNIRLEHGITQNQRALDDTVKAGLKLASESQDEAAEYIRLHGVYTSERERLVQELDSQHIPGAALAQPWPGKPSEINRFVDDIDSLRISDGFMPDVRAKILAFIDVIEPKMDTSGYASSTIAVGEGKDVVDKQIKNGRRFPRLNLGSSSIEQAASLVQANSWISILQISAQVVKPRQEELSDSQPNNKVSTIHYIAVSELTAGMLPLAVPVMASDYGPKSPSGPQYSVNPGSEILYVAYDIIKADEVDTLLPVETNQ